MTDNKGFSLIELVVTIAILGILSTTLIPRFATIRVNSQAQSNESVAIQIVNAAEARWIKLGVEPVDLSVLQGEAAGSLVAEGYLRKWPGDDYQISGNNGIYTVTYPVPSGANIRFDGIVGD